MEFPYSIECLQPARLSPGRFVDHSPVVDLTVCLANQPTQVTNTLELRNSVAYSSHSAYIFPSFSFLPAGGDVKTASASREVFSFVVESAIKLTDGFGIGENVGVTQHNPTHAEELHAVNHRERSCNWTNLLSPSCCGLHHPLLEVRLSISILLNLIFEFEECCMWW